MIENEDQNSTSQELFERLISQLENFLDRKLPEELINQLDDLADRGLLEKLINQLQDLANRDEANRAFSDPDVRAKFIFELLSNSKNSNRSQLQEVLSLRTVLSEETDRGCALMAAAYLDSELAKLIRARLVNDEKLAKDLLEFNGPLGSFSARIDFAYMLGLISSATRSNLHLLRKIRNEFAHVVSNISFKTSEISSRCHELTGFGLSKNLKPRAKFIRSMMITAASIHAALPRTLHIEKMQD